jgi:DNA helicase-2/ATP-dependent DNA helicase PcrA
MLKRFFCRMPDSQEPLVASATMAGGIDPLAGLNQAQRQAAGIVRGPVAILAGAGTGKTTTITHRIAHQVQEGAFEAGQILAMTFTQKAAGELMSRLAKLGVDGVEARTFHASALRQLRTLWPRYAGRELPEVLNAKSQILNPIANGLPGAYRFLPRRELAGEIEWAKNRLVDPDGYLEAIEAEGRTPPLPADLMHRAFEAYERTKGDRRMDFEDMLLMLVRLLDDVPEAARLIHERFHAFTVDEYQDVNPLQHALLDRWLGGRDELCVVGDDYQTIYTFTGASPSYLLTFPDRFPNATVVRLEENYRSTPQVLTVANALARSLGGFDKTLNATHGDGPNPTARALPDADAEISFVVGEAARLHGAGVPWEQIAVLYRINARSEAYEEALAAAGVPYQVRDGSFLRRPGPRGVIARLRRAEGALDVAEAVVEVTDAIGYAPGAAGDDAGEEETTRQADLGRMRALAAEYASVGGNEASVAGFLRELEHRFAAEREGRGVQLMTYHRAKGLEFDAVFLPRLLDGELPFRARKSEADPDEERRLLYVGITRAREHLFLSWPREPRTAPSLFLREIGVVKNEALRPAPAVRGPRVPVTVGAGGGPLFDRLKEWRRTRASTDGVPAYVVFHDKTLAEIAERKPRDWADLAAVPGIGPAKLDRYADEVLAIVSAR